MVVVETSGGLPSVGITSSFAGTVRHSLETPGHIVYVLVLELAGLILFPLEPAKLSQLRDPQDPGPMSLTSIVTQTLTK